ncbi:MAG: amidohydrolase family protein [Microthrixaceae bacterium]
MTDESEYRVVRAGWAVTMAPEGQGRDSQAVADPGVIEDAAIVISGTDIVEVGTWAEVRNTNPDAVVSHLPGHVLLPGLVNTHTHLAMTMFRGIADDRVLDEFLRTVLPLEARNLDEDRVERASRAAVVESQLCGVTSSVDMYFFPEAVLEAAQQAGGRVLTGPVVLDEPGPDAPEVDAETRLALAADFLAEHPPRDGWRPVVGPHATYTVSPEHLRDAAAIAREGGALLNIHAAETAQEVEMVAEAHGHPPVALLAELDVLGPDVLLAHGVHLEDTEVRMLAESGASVAHCPASNLKLASGVAPVQRLLSAGVNVSLGTDGPASSNDLDLLAATRLAALIHKATDPVGADATILPAPLAIAMATTRGASAVGLESRLGTLAPGMLADMVAIDLDRPFTQPVHDVCSAVVYAAGRDAVTDVWCEGRHVVGGGRHKLLDEAELSRDLADLGASLRFD